MDAKAGFLDRCKSTGKAPKTPAAPSQPAESKQGPKFVMTTRAQIRRLRRITNGTALHIFFELQLLAPYGKAQGKSFELPDATAFGFSRKQRHYALIELRKCGLISVKQRRGLTPLITMLATRVDL
jgi:hypothetical protein